MNIKYNFIKLWITSYQVSQITFNCALINIFRYNHRTLLIYQWGQEICVLAHYLTNGREL